MEATGLSEIFVDLGLLNREQLAEARAEMPDEEEESFIQRLLIQGLIDEEGLARSLATRYRLNMVPLDRLGKLNVSPEILSLLPANLMRSRVLLPTFLDEGKGVLSLLTADPTDGEALRQAQEAAGAERLRLFVAPRTALEALIHRLLPLGEDSGVHTALRSLTVAWEPVPQLADRLCGLVDPTRVAVARSSEEVLALLHAGRVERLLHRPEVRMLVDAYIPQWKRLHPQLLVGEVSSWGPDAQPAIPYDRSRDVLHRTIERSFMALERRDPEGRQRLRRLYQLARDMARRLELTLEQQDAVVLAAMLLGLEDPTADGGRFMLVREAVRELEPPYDLESILLALERRIAGLDGPTRIFEVEILYTARAAARLGLRDGEDVLAAFGLEATRHDGPTLRTLGEVLASRTPLPPSSPPETILLADRDTSLITALEARLTSVGFQVVSVGDGEQAMAAARRLPVAAVIANMRLPKKDGTTLLLELRRDAQLGDIPVFLLSESASPNDVTRGLELGAEDVLLRPFSLDGLLIKLRRVLDRRSHTAESAMRGQLRFLPLVELLQTLMMGGRTAWIHITSSAEDGMVQVRGGRIVAAELGAAWEGVEALYTMVDLDDGRFSVHFGDLDRTNIQGNSEFLLLEALRRRDERRG